MRSPASILVVVLAALLPLPFDAFAQADAPTSFSMAPVPFTVQLPPGWTAKRTAQTTVFSGPPGTPEAEAVIWIRLAPLVTAPGWTLDDFVAEVQRLNEKLPDFSWAAVERSRTRDGRQMRSVASGWSAKTTTGVMTKFRGVFIFTEFPDYIAIGQYSAPQAYFDRLAPPFGVIWNSLRCTSAPTPAPAAPPAAGRGTPFSIASPPYRGEMPAGWVASRSGDLTVIEGAKGSEAYEMTIRLAFYDSAAQTLDALAASVKGALTDLPAANVTMTTLTKTNEGKPARVLVVDYTGKDAAGRSVAFRQVAAVVDYGAHLVILTYSGPASLHDKYAGAFEMVGATLQRRGATQR